MSECNYYNYKIKERLNKDIEEINRTEKYISIILCVYSVNSEGKSPFLQYLLINNGYDFLTLPKLPIYTSFKSDEIIPYSNVYLSGMLKNNQYEQFSRDIAFDGFYEYNDDLYLFFDITKCALYINQTNHITFGLMDEILNHKKVCDIDIDNNTTSFFIKHEIMIYLYDKHNQPYDIPIVGFTGHTSLSKMNFTFIFGENANDKSGKFGPYFYFTNYHNSIQQIKNDKGGIVRFALFMGQTKYIENAPNDPIDESVIKKQRLEDDTIERKKEILTLRITDHDGLWSNNYDSVYLGNVELDDGSMLNDLPIIVVKNVKDQIPLSCHPYETNKRENNKYNIV